MTSYDDILIRADEIHKIDGGSFARIYPLFPELEKPSVRRLLYDFKKRQGLATDPDYQLPAATPIIEGARQPEIDEEEVWRRAIAVSRRTLTADELVGSIYFDYGTIGLVFLADLHLGSSGTDYERVDADIDLIMGTPGMYVVGVGDMLDNYIVGKLQSLRIDQTPFKVGEEWALVRYVLRRIAPKLVATVAGNHDNWTYSLAGIDYFKDVHDQIVGSHMLYDRNELRLNVTVGAAEFPTIIRHKWRGNSEHNPTHGMEKSAKLDGSFYARLFIGGHTHASGLIREFNNRGRTSIAGLCGSYKRVDGYAKTNGFYSPNEAAAITVILGEDGAMMGTSNLNAASQYLKALYRR